METLKPFEYLEPETVEEAVKILFTHGKKAKVLAGGIDLLPRMRQRLIQPEYVVCIKKIPYLDYVKTDGYDLKFGALVTLRALELSSAIKKNYLLLWEAIYQIASIQVKTMGTAVGNLCVATPASDIATALFALGAKLKIAGTASEKIIPIEDFYFGVKQIILSTSDIVTEVLLPGPLPGTGGAFLKLARTAHDLGKINVAVTVTITDNKCKDAKVALGSVAPTTIRARKAEEILKGQKLDSKRVAGAAEAAAEEAKPIDDLRSSAEYRKEATRVLTRRVIEKAIERAKE
jgi:carbon-monoxide dehydrogenase medium subunit